MNELQWAFSFHQDQCIQCHGCEGACKIWRRTEPGVKWRRVLNLWQGDYPNVTCAAVSISCQHCAEPACVAACPSQAITKREADELVVVDRSLCTGCRACLAACPFDVPQFGADGLMQKCDLCQSEQTGPVMDASSPPCVHTCPTGALELVKGSASMKITMERSMMELMNPL